MRRSNLRSRNMNRQISGCDSVPEVAEELICESNQKQKDNMLRKSVDVSMNAMRDIEMPFSSPRNANTKVFCPRAFHDKCR